MGMCMCTGEDCPAKDLCYRHTREPNPYRQAYFDKPPFYYGEIVVNEPPVKCDYFVRNDNEKD